MQHPVRGILSLILGGKVGVLAYRTGCPYSANALITFGSCQRRSSARHVNSVQIFNPWRRSSTTSCRAVVVGPARQRLARNSSPLAPIDLGEEHIARRTAVHLRLVDAVGDGQRLLEHCAAADDHDLVDAALLRADARNVKRCCQVVEQRWSPCGRQSAIARHDDVVAPVERLLQRLERAPPHDQRLAHGEAAERLEVR